MVRCAFMRMSTEASGGGQARTGRESIPSASGFTLIELPGVIDLITNLVAMRLPALAKTRQRDHTVNNDKDLVFPGQATLRTH